MSHLSRNGLLPLLTMAEIHVSLKVQEQEASKCSAPSDQGFLET